MVMNRHQRRRRKATKGDAIIQGITPEGKRALESGKPMIGNRPMTSCEWLMSEIVARTQSITVDHLTGLLNQTIVAFGGIDPALAAIRSGKVEFEPVADPTVEMFAANLGQTVEETMVAMRGLEKRGFLYDDGEGRCWLTLPGEDPIKRMEDPIGMFRYSRTH
jgi:hypothetical protein